MTDSKTAAAAAAAAASVELGKAPIRRPWMSDADFAKVTETWKTAKAKLAAAQSEYKSTMEAVFKATFQKGSKTAEEKAAEAKRAEILSKLSADQKAEYDALVAKAEAAQAEINARLAAFATPAAPEGQTA